LPEIGEKTVNHDDIRRAVQMRQDAFQKTLSVRQQHWGVTENVITQLARTEADIALQIADKLVEHIVTQLVEQGFKAELEKLTSKSCNIHFKDNY
jgi:membrane-associated HD superfamily phosphohydrolase